MHQSSTSPSKVGMQARLQTCDKCSTTREPSTSLSEVWSWHMSMFTSTSMASMHYSMLAFNQAVGSRILVDRFCWGSIRYPTEVLSPWHGEMCPSFFCACYLWLKSACMTKKSFLVLPLARKWNTPTTHNSPDIQKKTKKRLSQFQAAGPFDSTYLRRRLELNQAPGISG